MSRRRYQEIKQIVIQALETEGEERSSLVTQLCNGDETLMNDVMALISQDVGTVFLEDSPIELVLPDQDAGGVLPGRIGRIEINQLIARGGMGEVYAGVDQLLGRKVAVKVINPEMRFSDARRSAFLNEAKILSSLAHRNICQVFDFFEAENQDVLVMELIEGQTLRELNEHNQLENPLEIIQQILKGLSTAHERGIGHHDLKPENIMISKGNRVKILDFGLANKESTLGLNAGQPDSPILSGTPKYMSPERARGEATSSASDIWSLGLIIIELLSGHTWFPENADGTQMMRLAKDAKIDLPSKLPSGMSKIVRSMLSARSGDRPSAHQVLVAVEKLIERPKRRTKYALLAMAIAISSLFAWKYTSDLQSERNLSNIAKDQALQARAEAEELIAFMLTDLHEGLVSVGRLSLLESTAQQALKYYQKLDANNLQQSRGSPAMAMMHVAEVLDRQGDKQAAIELLKPAVAALEALHHRQPKDELVIFRLGWIHAHLAEIYLLTGDYKQSLAHSSNSIELGKLLTNGYQPGLGPQGAPTPSERWKVLLRGYYRQGDAFMRSGEGEKTIPVLEMAVAIALKAVNHEPSLMPFLSDIQFKRCDTYFDLKVKDIALAPCLSAFEFDKRAHQQNPDNFRLHSYFATSHFVLARVHNMLGQYSQAIKVADAAEKEFQHLINWDENNSSVLNDYSGVVLNRGIAYQHMSDLEQADAEFNKANELLKLIVEDKEETTYLNNQFAVAVYLGRHQEARSIASILLSRGFKRTVFTDLCQIQGYTECTEKSHSTTN